MEIPGVPMLAAPVEDWALPPGVAAEPKWDGWRALVGRLDDGQVVIRSRKGTDMADAFAEIAAAAAAQLRPGTLLDGELVVWSGGRLDFGALGGRLNRSAAGARRAASARPVSYVVFDVLDLDGAAQRRRTYVERRLPGEALGENGATSHMGAYGPGTGERGGAEGPT